MITSANARFEREGMCVTKVKESLISSRELRNEEFSRQRKYVERARYQQGYLQG